MTAKTSHNLVWFKRDLRVQDHEPLLQALSTPGKTMAVFFIEDAWFEDPHFDPRHLAFTLEALHTLKRDLEELNVPLWVLRGDAILLFQDLLTLHPFQKVFSHEETGLDWTYRRDRKVKVWFRNHSIEWKEFPQFGVIRALKSRDEWQRKREKILLRDLHPHPRAQNVSKDDPIFRSDKRVIPNGGDFGFQDPTVGKRQRGGRDQAMETLSTFVSIRGQNYLKSISSPDSGEQACSRLSPYLSYGNLSICEVFRKIETHQTHLGHRNADAVLSRLAWHCHFIQKFESEPELEFHPANRSFQGLRESEFREDYFEAWKKGETGVPLIDASMRCLIQTGWINFRMRAMLLSFASFQLWLHWRKPAEHLARLFLDFEPGIHYPQVQMQAAVTGINQIRIYNPEKQQVDQDPDGVFIKKYCPELRSLSGKDFGNLSGIPPLLSMSLGFQLGVHYPEPIVDLKESYDRAKKRIFEFHQSQAVRREARQVYLKHGSRKKAVGRSGVPS